MLPWVIHDLWSYLLITMTKWQLLMWFHLKTIHSCWLKLDFSPFKGSWEKKIIDRIHNTRSSKRLRDDSDGSPRKKGRPKGSVLLNRYPPVRVDTEFADTATDERNKRALQKELERDHPRKEHILSLMRQTYSSRRDDILSDSADVSVVTLLSTHPALSLPYVVRLPTCVFAFSLCSVHTQIFIDWTGDRPCSGEERCCKRCHQWLGKEMDPCNFATQWHTHRKTWGNF